MKAKIKLKLKKDTDFPELKMYIKLEDELFFWNEKTIFYIGVFKNTISLDTFYKQCYDFLSNKETIIQYGEQAVKNILRQRVEFAEKHSNKKEVEKLLKQFKQPIEIEVK